MVGYLSGGGGLMIAWVVFKEGCAISIGGELIGFGTIKRG